MGDPEILRAAFEEALENQLRDNNPPETAITLRRLLSEGFSEEDTRKMILSCIATNIFDVVKNKDPEKASREYIENLKNLPNAPFEEGW